MENRRLSRTGLTPRSEPQNPHKRVHQPEPLSEQVCAVGRFGILCAAFLFGSGVLAAAQAPGAPGQPGQGPPPGAPIFGEVAAVRGNVLQMRTFGNEGLTRVIVGSRTFITRNETCKVDILKPGMKVTGVGKAVAGTGERDVPLQVEVQSLQMEGAGTPPFVFGSGEPLTRGQRVREVFRKGNGTGTITFDAKVKSVNPLELTDEQDKPLPLVIGNDVEVVRRITRPLKEGDVTAGARLMAMGQPGADGLITAGMIVMLGEGSASNSLPATIMGVTDNGLKARPRYQQQDVAVELAPNAKVYLQERLDLDAIQIGEHLAFTGFVINGTEKAPKSLAVNTITAAEDTIPKLDQGGFHTLFGGKARIATVKGKLLGFDPVRVQTEDGREVLIQVPGQVVYARYRPMARSDLKAGQKVILGGKAGENGFVADLVIVTPYFTTGFGI